MSAARTSLPLNLVGATPGLPIGNAYSGKGVSSIYTTTIDVSARRKGTGDPIPGGDDVFACSMDRSLEFGSLYYLDGDEDHEVDYKQTVNGEEKTYSIPGAFRSVVLGANAGMATFHFHAGSQVGVATITCSVNDPQSGKQVSTSIQISVQPGLSSGKAAVIQVTKQVPSYLFIQGLNGPTQNTLVATVRDEAQQPVPDTANNVCARIVAYPNSNADDNARLISGAFNVPAGEWIRTGTVRGEAMFSAVSGNNTGPLAIEVRANRDGDFTRCDTFDIQNIAVLPVVDNAVSAPMTIVGTPTDAYVGEGYLYLLEAVNGLPPYFWSVVGGSLPPGLSLSLDGALTGTPSSAGTSSFTVRVEDGSLTDRYREERSVSLTVYLPVTISTASLPAGVVGVDYQAAVIATGGKPPLVYTAEGLPAGLTIDEATGVISGNPGAAGNSSVTVTVTDANNRSASKVLALTIAAAP